MAGQVVFKNISSITWKGLTIIHFNPGRHQKNIHKVFLMYSWMFI